MRNYTINIDRLVNQLIPHYLGGRKLILFLQSTLSPLKTTNKKWTEWANEKRIEASMTSQVIMLEYFLNKKFSKYFLNQSERIVISDGSTQGVPIYWEGNSSSVLSVVLYNANEPNKKDVTFRYSDETFSSSDFSFVVYCPSVDTKKISEAELTAMITYHINKYRIAGKTFSVIYNK